MSTSKIVASHIEAHRSTHEAAVRVANYDYAMDGRSEHVSTAECVLCHGPFASTLLAAVAPGPETPTRLIGPIPASYCSPVDDGVFAHPGGPAPRWGNYAPILVEVPLSWLSAEVQALVTQPGTCWGSDGRSLRGAIYRAHTTDTLLVLAADGWYVSAPTRPCRRAVTIAVEALKDGTVVCGLLAEEAAEAQRIHREGGATHRARLPWEAEPTYPAAEPVDDDFEIFRRTPDEE